MSFQAKEMKFLTGKNNSFLEEKKHNSAKIEDQESAIVGWILRPSPLQQIHMGRKNSKGFNQDPPKLDQNFVNELVYWRDPKKSAVVLAGILFLLIGLSCFSLISVMSYAALGLLSGTFGFRLYKSILQTVQKTQDGHPFKEYLEKDLSLQNEKTQQIVSISIEYLNKILIELRHLFLVEDLKDSIKFGVGLYLLTYVGCWFNGLTLAIIGIIGLFSMPKVYELNKNVIDQYLDLIFAKVSQTIAKFNELLPFGNKDKTQ